MKAIIALFLFSFATSQSFAQGNLTSILINKQTKRATSQKPSVPKNEKKSTFLCEVAYEINGFKNSYEIEVVATSPAKASALAEKSFENSDAVMTAVVCEKKP